MPSNGTLELGDRRGHVPGAMGSWMPAGTAGTMTSLLSQALPSLACARLLGTALHGESRAGTLWLLWVAEDLLHGRSWQDLLHL